MNAVGEMAEETTKHTKDTKGGGEHGEEGFKEKVMKTMLDEKGNGALGQRALPEVLAMFGAA